MAVRYNIEKVEEGIVDFMANNPEYSKEDIAKKRTELIAREFVVQLWTDNYRKLNPGKSENDIKEYENKVRTAPEKEMKRPMTWLSKMEEPRFSRFMEAIQRQADSAEDVNYLKKTLGYTYPVFLRYNPENMLKDKMLEGEEYYDGLFAAAPDSSGMQFEGIIENKTLSVEELREIQDEADAIVIRPNEEASEMLIPYIVMGRFFTQENLAGMERYLFAAGSTIPQGFNPVNGAKANFFENTLNNDQRMNMHAVRSFAPAARRSAQRIVDSKNRAEIRNTLSNCFSILYNQAFSTSNIISVAWHFPVRKLNDFLIQTARQGIRPEDLGITEKQLENVKIMNAVLRLQQQRIKLQSEITHAAEELVFSDFSADFNPFENPALMEKLEEDFVLDRALYRIGHGIGAVKLAHELAGAEAGERLLPERPVSDEELEYYHDPEGYLNKVRAEAKTLNAYKNFLKTEHNDGNALDLLSGGIKTDSKNMMKEEFRLDIFFERTLPDALDRIYNTVKGTSLEATIRPDAEGLAQLAQSAARPYGIEIYERVAQIATSMGDKTDAYIASLGPGEIGSTQNAVIAQLGGNFNSVKHACRIFIEEETARRTEGLNSAAAAEADAAEKISSLAAALTATEGNWTKNTNEYDQFSAAVKAIPQALAAHNENPLTNNTLAAELSNAAALAGAYLATHETIKSPSDRQIRRMDLARQVRAMSARVNDRVAAQFDAQEQADAIKWFAGFRDVLKAEGINEFSPYSLARICILHDTKYDADKDLNTISAKERDELFAEADRLYTYAFMKQNAEGNYEVNRPAEKADLTWLAGNMQKPVNLSDSEIVRLYRSAKDMRLVIRSTDTGSEAKLSPKFVVVTTDGKANCTANGEAFLPGVTSNRPDVDYRDYGITEADAKLLTTRELRRYEVTDSAIFNKSVMYREAAFESQEVFNEFHDAYSKDEIERKLVIQAADNPGWFASKEQRTEHEKAMTAVLKPEERRSEEERKLLNKDQTVTESFAYFRQSLEKRFGTTDFGKLMSSGKILKSDRTPFDAEDSFDFINQVYAASRNGQGIWAEYEKDGAIKSGIFVSYTDKGLTPAVKISDYGERIKQARAEVSELRKLGNAAGIDMLEKGLTEQEKTVREGTEKNVIYTQEGTFSAIANVINRSCKAYIESLPADAELTDEQIRSLCILADLKVFEKTASSFATDLRGDTVKRIAVAAVCNRAAAWLRSGNDDMEETARRILTDTAERNRVAEELMASDDFRQRIEGKSPEELEILREEVFALGADEGNELRNARIFARELGVQLAGLGYDSPLPMGLVCVRNDDITPDMIMKMGSSAQELQMQYRMIEESQQMAFIPRDRNGVITEQRREGESRIDWIQRVSRKPDALSDEQKLWLYRAAKEGRLMLRSDDLTADAGAKTEFILAGDDNKPVMGINITKLEENGRELGFTDNEIQDIQKKAADNASIGVTAGMLLGSAGISLRNRLNHAHGEEKIAKAQEEYDAFLAIRDDCFELTSLQNVLAMSHSHSSWFDSPEDIRQITKTIGLGYKDRDDYTEEDFRLGVENSVIGSQGYLMEAGLLKKGGFDSVKQMRESGKITDRLGNVITADTDYRYLNKLYKKIENSEELFIEGKPYRLITGVGISRGTDKAGYAAEAKYISELFKKSGLKASSEGPDYAYLAELMDELPQRINDIKLDIGDNDVELQTILSQVSAVGSAYIRQIGNGKLSGAQLKCIKALNRLTDLKDKAFRSETRPEKGTEDKLAEKIATSYAIRNIKAASCREYMLNPDRRKNVIAQIKTRPEFRTLLNESKKVGLDKVMKISGDKLYSQYDKLAKQAAKDKNPPEAAGPIIG